MEKIGDTEKVIETVSNKNKKGDEIKFSPIVYKEVGTHTYVIRELKGDNNKIDYDSHSKEITVDVKEDNKKLHASVKMGEQIVGGEENQYDVGCGFVIYGLYYVEVTSLYAYFLDRKSTRLNSSH